VTCKGFFPDRTVLSFHKSAEIIISALLPKDRYPTLPPLFFTHLLIFPFSKGKKHNMEFSYLSFTFASQKTRETPK
jgi:hypothetical protein